jgi:CzcA family heavy metal efflux pump
MSPAAFSIRNRALVNAAILLVVVIGAFSFVNIPRELTPKVSFNWVFLFVDYPGANPEEVENLITIPIEDEMETVDDVDVVTSRTRRGNTFVWLRFEQISDEDFERRLDDVRARMADVDLPDAAEDPVIQEFSSYDFEPVVTAVVRGSAPEHVLHRLAKDLREDLRDVPGVDDVESFGDRDRALLVEVDPLKLEAHRLDVTDVENALRLANLNLPAGVIKLGGEEFLLRTRSEFSAAEEIETVTLRAGRDGRRVRIGDVATLTDGFEDRTVTSRFDGEPAITLAITKREDGNTIEIVEGVREVLDGWRDRLPAGVSLAISNDQSVQIGDILGVLQSNAALGLVLVVVALGLFVGWQGAAVAALGIPVTFLIAVIAMHWTGQSLNGSTLFGLILVLGMVVDDAVVVLENAFRHLEKGKDRVQAMIDGAGQVTAPVIVSSLTTMGGFLPLVLMSGTTGKFMRIVPIVVSLVLVASLVEALFVLPSHFVDIVRRPPKKPDGPRWWERLYLALLRRFLPARYVVVAVSLVCLVASAALIPLIGIDLFGGEEISAFQIFVTMPDGTRLERTDAVLAEFERHALELPGEELQGVTVNAGLAQLADEWQFHPHVGQIVVDLVEPTQRRRSIDEIMETVRRSAESIPGPTQVEFKKRESGPPEESPIELMVKGPDLDVIAAAAKRLEEELQSYPGVLDVRDDLDLTQRELDVVVDREAAVRRQLDATRIASTVRGAFGGSTAATTFREEDEEIDVIVRYPEELRAHLDNVTDMRFVTPAGEVVPFTEVARLEERRGPVTIRRHDGERQVTVKANVDQAVTDIGRVHRTIYGFFEEIRTTFPGVRIEPGGQFQEFIEAFNNLAMLFGVGLLVNFMLMAGQFKNWAQPLLIMAVVPLSFIGAMVGLLVSGEPFSISTLYGFVALAGVAVNDSIVLVDFINKARREGHEGHESLIEAGRVRLRPILLTSITTILGLLPMSLGLGGASDVWQPLATTIAAGLMVATIISLLMIPCLQAILDDLARWTARLLKREVEVEVEVEATAAEAS